MERLRSTCAEVARRAQSVTIEAAAVPAYAHALARLPAPREDPEAALRSTDRRALAAFWLTLNAINFGSGWFPTLRKRSGRSGYHTIAISLRERFDTAGAWPAQELAEIDVESVAATLGQDPGHELMALFTYSLRDLGARVGQEAAGDFTGIVDAAGGSAVTLTEHLGSWPCFADASRYEELEVPFLKRAQIAAADLHRAGVADFADLGRLTMFADNLVPHVLRLDGVLSYDADLASRIDAGELLEHGSPEEVELRACALQAVELLVAESRGRTAAEIDQLLWLRGQGASYKARPRHRSRCTAY